MSSIIDNDDDDDVQTISVEYIPPKSKHPQKKRDFGPQPGVTYEFEDGVNLDALINEELRRLDIGTVFRQDLTPIDEKVTALEAEKNEIESMFNDAFESMKKVREMCEAQERFITREMEEEERVESTIVIDDDEDYDYDDEAYTEDGRLDDNTGYKEEEREELIIDDDDDVQIIDTTYVPKKKPMQLTPSKISGNVIQVNGPLDSTQLAKLSDGQLIQMVNDQGKKIKTYRVRKVPFYQTQRRASLPPPKVGMKVYAMKKHEIWYRGTLSDITDIDNEIQYKVKYDGKGLRVVSGKEIAYYNDREKLPLGTRVIAQYKEDDKIQFYAGITAEPPSTRNNYRYLIFFDDGYAQYSPKAEVLQVFLQSSNVWEDVGDASKDFVKTYLEQYPERPMVRLQKNQIVKTEWNGKWWTARVQEVDASLVKMYFDADKRTEWIYRGSTRLAPLYTELANAEASKNLGKARRTMVQKGGNRPIVEYTRGNETEENADMLLCDDTRTDQSATSVHLNNQLSTFRHAPPPPPPPVVEERRAVAKKSTGNRPSGSSTISSVGAVQKMQSGSVAGLLQMQNQAQMMYAQQQQPRQRVDRTADEDSLGERVDLTSAQLKMYRGPRTQFTSHMCNGLCISGYVGRPADLKGQNPLIIPMYFGWERLIARLRTSPTRRHTYYRSPCGRRLRSMEEVDLYLQVTHSDLTIDMFCFDYSIHPFTEFRPVKTYCDIKDLSYGKENVPISCVNGCDRNYPDYVEYSNQRLPAKGVKLNLDPNYLCGCNCQDDCRDREKCACRQLTVQMTEATREAERDPQAGYDHKRLKDALLTGIYECNSQCKCNHKCQNRVAQQGLQLRLQVFKTEKRGWGLRCLDDIPEGGFVCIYAGQLLTDAAANEDGHQYGDEYLAELDHIEMISNLKEGYESDVLQPSDIEDSADDASNASDSEVASNDDSAYADSNSLSKLKRALDGAEPRRSKRMRPKTDGTKGVGDKGNKRSASFCMDSDSLPDLVPQGGSSSQRRRPESDDSDDESNRGDSSRLSKMPDPKSLQGRQSPNKPDKYYGFINPRKYFGEESCYIMDAKSIGNIGRYLNHSCEPNIFVQNVFVDTHDLRFPWVAFFASENIRAGTELTWDYNYDVGSVPDKVLWCFCGSAKCRGRLL